MPVLVFLVDTSSSMNQRTHLGITSLDIAKGAVETFMKLRARDQTSRTDRYMLVSCDEPPGTIKAGWKENHMVFMNELKNLQATSLTGLGRSLKMTFDLLNVNRLYSGIDNYGQGRNPFFLEPALIIAITDGHKLTTNNNVQDELHLPMSVPLPGSELTREPFRWDQRLFSLVLRIPGASHIDTERGLGGSLVNTDDSPINAMCEVTGGRSYCVKSMKMLNQCLESLVQKVHSGVVLNFEKIGPEPPMTASEAKSAIPTDGRKSPRPVQDAGDIATFATSLNSFLSAEVRQSFDLGPGINGRASPNPDTSWHACRKLIYVKPNPKTGVPIGHWPIPESFWPDANTPSLQPRDSQPAVKFVCTNSEPMALDNVPFDKYELEPSPLTQYILERRNPIAAWQVFVNNSGKTTELGHPFGYLKASTQLTAVNLFIMPYNYPVLLPLLDDLFKIHKLKPTVKWRQAFENYLRDVPNYYAGPLKIALRRMGAPNLIPEGMENCLNYSVVTHLKKLKQQSKLEAERLSVIIGKSSKPHESGIKVNPRSQMPSLAARKDFQQLLQRITGETITIRPDSNVTEFSSFVMRVPDKEIRPQMYRNPFDIPRKDLVDQVIRMRANFLQVAMSKSARFMNEDKFHHLPQSDMGNYQEYLKRMPAPLREADPAPARLHTFGNPFKLASDKDKHMMVDEADVNEAMTGPQQRSKRSADTPPGSPAAKRLRSGALSPSPPSRRPSSPGIPGGLQGGLLKKPIEQLIQIRQRTEVQSPAPVEYKYKAPEINIIDEDGEPHQNNNDDHLHGDLAMEVDMETQSDSELNNHVEPNRTEKQLTTGQSVNRRTRVRGSGGGRTGNGSINNADVQEYNNNLRKAVIREVRKPGKDFGKLFEHLNSIQGNLDTKYLFVNSIIREAGRFKRKHLIGLLEAFQQSMIRYEETMKQKAATRNHVGQGVPANR